VRTGYRCRCKSLVHCDSHDPEGPARVGSSGRMAPSTVRLSSWFGPKCSWGGAWSCVELRGAAGRLRGAARRGRPLVHSARQGTRRKRLPSCCLDIAPRESVHSQHKGHHHHHHRPSPSPTASCKRPVAEPVRLPPALSLPTDAAVTSARVTVGRLLFVCT